MAYGRDSDAFCVANARVCSEASADLAFPCGCGLNRWLGDGGPRFHGVKGLT